MFSNLVFKRLLQLSHRSVCCRHLILNRLLNEKSLAISRCLSHASEVDQNNQMIIREKIQDFAVKAISSPQTRNHLKDIDVNDKELWDLIGDRKVNALSEEPDYEMLDEISPPLSRSFNLAAFADKSVTLQMLIKLGVDLNYIENKNPEEAEYILKLDFESDVKPYIRFLVDNGVSPEFLGFVITRNPMIFSQNMEDLEIRIRYLESKRFTKEMISRVIIGAPKLLNMSTKSVDYRLGLLQKDFQLSADEVRKLMITYPKMALLHQMCYQVITFAYKEEFGFNSDEIKEMLLKYPKVFHKLGVSKKGHRVIVKVFDLVHNEMKIPHELIAKNGEILDWKIWQIEGRHKYLKKLGRDQYDPKQPLYVPLSAFYTIEDNEFCERYAKTSVHDFNMFSKTL